MILSHAPAALFAFLLWGFVILLLGVAVTFALLAWLRKLGSAIWVSAASLALALLISFSATTSQLSTEQISIGGAAGAIIALLSITLAALGGGPVTQLALSLATRGSVTAGEHGGILVSAAPSTAAPTPVAESAAGAKNTADAASAQAAVANNANTGQASSAEPPQREVLRGGAAIGVLERVCAVLGIIAGFPEALAIIIAIKGLGRFTELATAEARERFIIGTLASLLWASACGVLVRIALGF